MSEVAVVEDEGGFGGKLGMGVDVLVGVSPPFCKVEVIVEVVKTGATLLMGLVVLMRRLSTMEAELLAA